MSRRSILRNPLVYQSFQRAGGYFQARLEALRAILPLAPGTRIADIGCGPGFLAEHLPADVAYHGFDTDDRYIAFAKTHFAARGAFFHRPFDRDAARHHGPFDVVMMNGLLHHLDDDEAGELLRTVRQALANGGRLFTLDGCFADGQSAVARFLLRHDRGRHVRTESGYRELLSPHFDSLDVHVDHSLSWSPYTWIVMIGRA